ncbi:hypothetical protein HYV10_02345 [Candidatus Dependentiae bacterium]|nr:hypothetical protein [Candidatus Dependentiae bacterium]
MKNFIQFGLITTLVITMPILGAEAESQHITEGIPLDSFTSNIHLLTREQKAHLLQNENTQREADLLAQKELKGRAWAYDSRTNLPEEKSRPLLYQQESEPLSLKNLSKKINVFFSDLWNGFWLKRTVIKFSENNDVRKIIFNEKDKEAFKKLSNSKQLEVINHFVKKEIERRDDQIKELTKLNKRYAAELIEINHHLTLLAKNISIRTTDTIITGFNERLNKFRTQINLLLINPNKHLEYDIATKEFKFHVGEDIYNQPVTNNIEKNSTNNPNELTVPPTRPTN